MCVCVCLACGGSPLHAILPFQNHSLTSRFRPFLFHSFRLWLKGGRELPDDIRQKVQGDGSLVISPVQKQDDSGVYTCWARNKQGHSARRSGEVTVIGKVFV